MPPNLLEWRSVGGPYFYSHSPPIVVEHFDYIICCFHSTDWTCFSIVVEGRIFSSGSLICKDDIGIGNVAIWRVDCFVSIGAKKVFDCSDYFETYDLLLSQWVWIWLSN